MSLALPCAMRAYKGTKWYKRLICAEYAIALDSILGASGEAPAALGHGERHSIHDASLLGIPEGDARLESYRRQIIAMFSAPDLAWDEESPFGLLHRLRTLKASLFSPEEIAPPRGGGDRPRLGLRPEELRRLGTLAAHTGGLILIPDGDRPELASGLLESLSERLGRVPRLALGPALGAWPKEVARRASHALAPWWSLEAEDIQKLASEAVVACADLRYAYGFLACGSPVITLLDDGEWYGAVLNAGNRVSDDRLAQPSESAYRTLLRAAPTAPLEYRLRFWETAIPERERSGLYPLGGSLPSAPSQLPATVGFYRKDSSWTRVEGPGPEVVHAACAIVKARDVCPEFYDRMTDPATAPRGARERALYLSFNYYMTDNLLAWRKADGRSDPPWRRFMLDYLYAPRIAPGFESLPLYPKTLLGRSKSGRLFAGAYRPGTIRALGLDGRELLVFDSGRVDQADATRVGLYTPAGGRRLVGAGRWCTTLVHDHVWEARPGPVSQPSFGVVVVSDEPLGLGSTLRWDVEWIGLPCAKEELEWLVGGFNALVLGGEDLCPDDQGCARRLEAEGWTNPLSAETQETQLVSGVRQPRCCVGATKSGRIVALAASGRSSLSVGASFSELSSLAGFVTREAGDELDFLVNLDGGASAMLYAASPEHSALLSIPSPSDNNPAGVSRKVPALLKISLPEEA